MGCYEHDRLVVVAQWVGQQGADQDKAPDGRYNSTLLSSCSAAGERWKPFISKELEGATEATTDTRKSTELLPNGAIFSWARPCGAEGKEKKVESTDENDKED